MDGCSSHVEPFAVTAVVFINKFACDSEGQQWFVM